MRNRPEWSTGSLPRTQSRVPTEALDPEVTEVGLPRFVRTAGGLGERIGGGHQPEARALDQVEPFKAPKNA